MEKTHFQPTLRSILAIALVILPLVLPLVSANACNGKWENWDWAKRNPPNKLASKSTNTPVPIPVSKIPLPPTPTPTPPKRAPKPAPKLSKMAPSQTAASKKRITDCDTSTLTKSMPANKHSTMAQHNTASMTAQTSTAAPSNKPSSAPTLSPAPKNAPVSTLEPRTVTAAASSQPVTTGSACGSDAFFCENFEDLPTGANVQSPKWHLDGAAAITGMGARGRRALHLTPTGGRNGRLIVDNFSPPGNSFYGRIYAKVDKFATNPPFAHFVMTEVLGKQGEERLRPLGGQYVLNPNGAPGGRSLWGVGADGGPTGDWTAWQRKAPTTDGAWTCLEWELRSEDNSVNVWIDGKARPELSITNGQSDRFHTKLVFPKFRQIWFGWWVFQGDTTPSKFDVLIDDIVLSKKRVGCL